MRIQNALLFVSGRVCKYEHVAISKENRTVESICDEFMRKVKKQNSRRDTNPRPVSAKLFKKRFPNNFFSFFVSRGDSDYLCTMDCGNHWLPNDLQGKCFLSHENVCTIIKDFNFISEKTFNFESILKRHSPVRVKKLCLDKSLKSKRKSPCSMQLTFVILPAFL